MAHTCPECGQTCFCNGDIDDINMGEDINCKHWRQCEGENDWDDDDDFYDDIDDEDHPLNPPIKKPVT
jgi:hypothetical protein